MLKDKKKKKRKEEVAKQQALREQVDKEITSLRGEIEAKSETKKRKVSTEEETMEEPMDITTQIDIMDQLEGYPSKRTSNRQDPQKLQQMKKMSRTK